MDNFTKMIRFLLIALAVEFAIGFSVSSGKSAPAVFQNRRAFLDSSLATIGCVLIVGPANAEESPEDLSMPSQEEQQKIDMEERLRRKAELQKKASRPQSFQRSLVDEREKQKSLGTMTKEERRNALCEELGRGC